MKEISIVPARVDQASGSRYYDTVQLKEACLVVMLRELQSPLKAVKQLRPLPLMGGRAGTSFCIEVHD